MTSDPKTGRPNVLIGLGIKGDAAAAVVIILVGAFLLLRTTGIFPPWFVISFWALIFVIGGLIQLLSSSSPNNRVWGVGLILVGVIFELNALHITHLGFRNLWPVFIILLGCIMLWQALTGNKGGAVWRILESNAREDAAEQVATAAPGSLNLNYIFSGTDRKVRTKNFNGGNISAIFGGFKIDLTRAEMEGDKAVLEANVIFGGGEIIAPESWVVSMEGSSVFGGFDDKTRHFQPDPSQPTKTLVIKGSAVFGAVVVKSD
ncbi:MAG: cell wall-active antibiotics response protein [Acidobacteriia bacterium]|nr:cell wall-active antibiotics response protein [Terriglobia bacterium]